MVHAVDSFSGFGHEALIAVCGLMVVGHGLVRTGALEPLGRVLARLWSHSPQLSLLVTLLLAGRLLPLQRGRGALVYALGAVSAFWLLERLGAVLA